MPKQNRPLVRDGRIQARKKRTDRSYLGSNGGATGVAEDVEAEENLPEAPAVEEAAAVREPAPPTDEAPDAAAPDAGPPATPEPAPTPAPAPVSSSTAAPGGVNGAGASTNGAATAGRLTGTARALQQQGVRKRREFDVDALAVRDSKYAMHEIRRIGTLAVMVIVTLIVLSLVLR
ncbi:MAG TPA: hypothetical protein VFY79_11440 [Dehalococcoidia bacterium]|nr:hypothetical protein [Dehalococcoidia bacterium]